MLLKSQTTCINFHLLLSIALCPEGNTTERAKQEAWLYRTAAHCSSPEAWWLRLWVKGAAAGGGAWWSLGCQAVVRGVAQPRATCTWTDINMRNVCVFVFLVTVASRGYKWIALLCGSKVLTGW